MPRGDKSGPSGQGPMTGRQTGFCAGYDAPGCANPIPRRGFGRGWGRERGWRGGGRGWRHRYHATGQPGWARAGYGPAWGPPPAYAEPYAQVSGTQEVDMLKGQAEWLKGELEAISQRLAELETEE